MDGPPQYLGGPAKQLRAIEPRRGEAFDLRECPLAGERFVLDSADHGSPLLLTFSTRNRSARPNLSRIVAFRITQMHHFSSVARENFGEK